MDSGFRHQALSIKEEMNQGFLDFQKSSIRFKLEILQVDRKFKSFYFNQELKTIENDYTIRNSRKENH